MGVLALFAYGLIAYGSMIVFFCVTVARHAHEIIILMAAAFFWLVALLLTSIWWKMVPPLWYTPAFTVPVSVLIQELFRFLYFLLLRKSDKVLEMIYEDKSPLRKHKIAYVSGLGFGVIAAVAAFGNILRDSGGPGVVGVRNDSQFFILESAFGANVLWILHVVWAVLWHSGWEAVMEHGWRKAQSIVGLAKVGLVIASHLTVSCMSLASSPLYFLVSAHVTAVVLVALAMHIAGARVPALKHFFLK